LALGSRSNANGSVPFHDSTPLFALGMSTKCGLGCHFGSDSSSRPTASEVQLQAPAPANRFLDAALVEAACDVIGLRVLDSKLPILFCREGVQSGVPPFDVLQILFQTTVSLTASAGGIEPLLTRFLCRCR
jgi:hypothetical protein